MEFTVSFFVRSFLLVTLSCCRSFSSWTLIAVWLAALWCLSPNTCGWYQAWWSPRFGKNLRRCDRFSGLPLRCIIFNKVTLTVRTTHINYFILPSTAPKFFLCFNRGDLVGKGWSMESLSGLEHPHPQDLFETCLIKIRVTESGTFKYF